MSCPRFRERRGRRRVDVAGRLTTTGASPFGLATPRRRDTSRSMSLNDSHPTPRRRGRGRPRCDPHYRKGPGPGRRRPPGRALSESRAMKPRCNSPGSCFATRALFDLGLHGRLPLRVVGRYNLEPDEAASKSPTTPSRPSPRSRVIGQSCRPRHYRHPRSCARRELGINSAIAASNSGSYSVVRFFARLVVQLLLLLRKLFSRRRRLLMEVSARRLDAMTRSGRI